MSSQRAREGPALMVGPRRCVSPSMYRDMDMRFWPEQAEAELKELG